MSKSEYSGTCTESEDPVETRAPDFKSGAAPGLTNWLDSIGGIALRPMSGKAVRQRAQAHKDHREVPGPRLVYCPFGNLPRMCLESSTTAPPCPAGWCQWCDDVA